MTHLVTPDDPFGPFLSPLHRYILRNAEPITWSNAYQVALVPLAPLGLQAYLLQYAGTRIWRAAIGVVGCTLMLNAWVGYRFEREHPALSTSGGTRDDADGVL